MKLQRSVIKTVKDADNIDETVVILKLGLRSMSNRITSLIFSNIYTPPQHALTHIILFALK